MLCLYWSFPTFSVKPTSACASSQSVSAATSSPPIPEKPSSLELHTPNYSDNLSEEEVEKAVVKTMTPASSPRPPSPALDATVSGEDLEQSEDGGATPTQDESGTLSDGKLTVCIVSSAFHLGVLRTISN